MPNIREGLLNLVSGAPDSPYRGLLSPEADNRARGRSLTDASLAMMLGSTGAPGAPAPTFMQALSRGLQAGRNTYGNVADAEIINRQALQQIQAGQRAQAGQAALSRHFATNPISPESLKAGARIALSFGDTETYKALLEQISTITPEAVADERTNDERNYDRTVLQGSDSTFESYMQSKEPPPAAEKPDRIPQNTLEDMVIIRTDAFGNETKSAVPFGTTWDQYEALRLEEGVTIKSRVRLEDAELKRKQDDARKADVELLSTDLLSIETLLTGGNTGGRIKSAIGFIANTDEYNELDNLYEKLRAQFTLTTLAEAKAKGITFGALSDGERIMVANSVGRLEQSQSPELQRLELSRIVGAFARHGLVDESRFSPEFLALAKQNASTRLAEIKKEEGTSEAAPTDLTSLYKLED